jgi:tRNA-splicing ligase RtcB
MGRNAARKTISEREYVTTLEGTYTKTSMTYIDEAPGAYKDIDTVIEQQRDLVDVVRRLQPIITVKGDSRARED